MGEPQLDYLEAVLDTIRAEGVPGDVAEVGVRRGGGAIFMRVFLEAYEIPETRVWAVDPFFGTLPAGDDESTGTVPAMARFGADVNQVCDGFARFDLYDDRRPHPAGPAEDVLRDAPIERLALLVALRRTRRWFVQRRTGTGATGL